MKKLHPKGPRSLGRRKRSGSGRTTKGVQVTLAPNHRDIDLPQIFVKVPPTGGYGWRFAKARIVVRRRGKKWYRYLAWKQNGETRMHYMGSVKISAPSCRRGPRQAWRRLQLEQKGGKNDYRCRGIPDLSHEVREMRE